MKRVDYAEPPLTARIGAARRPLVLALAAILTPLAAHELERLRAAALARHVAVETREASRWESEAAALRALERERDALRARLAERDRLRRSGESRAAELAAIGNAIPASTWLASLRVDGSAYAVDARARSLSGVAATIASLARLPAVAGVRLVDARDGGREAFRYTLAIERRR